MFVCLTLVLFAWRCASAQLVATKDLTKATSDESQKAKTPQTPQYNPPATTSDKKAACDYVLADGWIVPKVPEKLRLEIVSVDPEVLHPGEPLLVTVRLVNVGANGVLVPWDTPLVKPDIDPKTGKLSWDAASVSLDFSTQEDSRSRSQLKGEARLVAAPSHREQHVELLPGQWLDVRFKVTLECDSVHFPACRELPTSANAELRASWSEWRSTYEDDGCNKRKGTYESRKVYSKPLSVVENTTATPNP